VADVTSRYPVQVIAGVLGVPTEDYELFQRWGLEISMGPEDYDVSKAASRAMREYLTPLVERCKPDPGDDLVSDIVTAEIDGERLSDEHIYGFLRLLLPAGAETTFRALGNCMVALLTDPPVLARVRADRSLLDAVIEETLRWETSVTMVNRETACPVEIGDVTVPAGVSVVVATGSANHDETRYDNGEVWDLDRPATAHLAFGTGRHQCLGMHLARLELRVGLAAILDRLPGLRLDPAADAPCHRGPGLPLPAAPRRPLRLLSPNVGAGTLTDRGPFMTPKITIVGGGSTHWTPRLLADFANTASLHDCSVALTDIDESSLPPMLTIAKHIVTTRGIGMDVTATTDLGAALDGADFVIIALSVGGFASMAHDLDIPSATGSGNRWATPSDPGASPAPCAASPS
jgi:hypothetical protein